MGLAGLTLLNERAPKPSRGFGGGGVFMMDSLKGKSKAGRKRPRATHRHK
jgi:hypothetical protein